MIDHQAWLEANQRQLMASLALIRRAVFEHANEAVSSVRSAETSDRVQDELRQAEDTIRAYPALSSSWFIFSRSLATRLIASRIAGFVATRRLKSSPRRTSSWQ